MRTYLCTKRFETHLELLLLRIRDGEKLTVNEKAVTISRQQRQKIMNMKEINYLTEIEMGTISFSF